ncbi:MAG TPA: class I SAM-dependent methyltransferase [Polyangia bacterium]|nr:class I SAM-dependent methyltransferase [Polyangia bacterium]
MLDAHQASLAPRPTVALTTIDWAGTPLPATWPDGAGPWRARLRRFAAALAGAGNAVAVPDNLPGRSWLPAYLLREFHRMPNGYYSATQARGYERGFEWAMLGRMREARLRSAARLRGARRALDVGCGTGRLAGALREAGVPDVVGLDPCPYLLQVAARRFPGVRFVQGLGEATGFPERAFDGAAACFVFHELPSAIADRMLGELHRVLAPGGLLAITEPSPEQLHPGSLLSLVRRGGLSALWFRALALLAREPYIADWHAKEPASWLARAGFDLVEDETEIPFRFLLARRRAPIG